jgi:hypothetical protein
MLDLIQVIAANVFQALEGSLVVLCTGLASIALHKLCVKFHLDNEAALKDGLDYALKNAVHSAESWAGSKAAAPSGSEKMDEAIKVARMLLTNEAFRKFTDEQLKKLLESALNQHIDDTPAPPAPTADSIANAVAKALTK